MREIFSAFYQSLERFDFSKAALLIQAESSKEDVYPFIREMLPPLLLWIACEKVYYNFGYLNFNDENHPENYLSSLYSRITRDMNQLIVVLDTLKDCSNDDYVVGELGFVSDLIKQTLLLVNMRRKTIAIYCSLSQDIDGRPEFMDLVLKLKALQSTIHICIHPYLSQIKDNLLSEINIIQKLLYAQVLLEQYKYKAAILAIYQCKMELSSEKHNALDKDAEHPLFKWYYNFLDKIIGKTVFYFHRIFTEKEIDLSAIKSITSDLKVNYHEEVKAFSEVSGCNNFSIILDVEPTEKNSGIRSWPCVYSYPEKRPPMSEMPTIISLVEGLDEPWIIHEFNNEDLDKTYTISRIETDMFIVISFENRKDEAQNEIVTQFLQALISRLQFNHIFDEYILD
eukprot:TRINITY_DN9510_c0_g1_i2.p1 TRINITY_DN9510_c0_g1~~TRINITY_DN9510_c0_g1_i2.p1  ORF type:complete len:397 (-),score=70.48 TRINITY_DN9510_c0_g1_i2:190-1380(-)